MMQSCLEQLIFHSKTRELHSGLLRRAGHFGLESTTLAVGKGAENPQIVFFNLECSPSCTSDHLSTVGEGSGGSISMETVFLSASKLHERYLCGIRA